MCLSIIVIFMDVIKVRENFINVKAKTKRLQMLNKQGDFFTWLIN